MSDLVSSARYIATIELDGSPLTLAQIQEAFQGRFEFKLTTDPRILQKLKDAENVISSAVEDGREIYGVTTGFGSMANVEVPTSLASRLQNNLLSFLAAGAGAPIDSRHVRVAMLLRANMLMRGCSGVRLELIERLVHFLNSDAIPVVKELGSIGASGDLVPLSTIARAITGQTGHCEVEFKGEILDGHSALERLGLEPMELQAKEGLAIVNGTSFSAAIAGNVCLEAQHLTSLSMMTNAMMLRALNVQAAPFDEFVHDCKPHRGQIWVAQTMRELLFEAPNGHAPGEHVQDRYSLRCLPQYYGPAMESLARICETVEIEMNAVSDNPLIDTDRERCVQNGNFLGQYIAQAMDDLRSQIGLIAKHLDVQIAQLVSPEFNLGLPASLRGNDDVVYNMGLKGLQITGNSIMPMLTYYGNPLTSHYPTHAEQFNQNINGLSWGSAHLAWKSIELFQTYSSIALIFAVQSLDLRARDNFGHCDGRELIGSTLRELYDSLYETLGLTPGREKPFLKNDSDQWLEEQVEKLTDNLRCSGNLLSAIQPVQNSWAAFREQ